MYIYSNSNSFSYIYTSGRGGISFLAQLGFTWVGAGVVMVGGERKGKVLGWLAELW
jgi:hypothetical protein